MGQEENTGGSLAHIQDAFYPSFFLARFLFTDD